MQLIRRRSPALPSSSADGDPSIGPTTLRVLEGPSVSTRIGRQGAIGIVFGALVLSTLVLTSFGLVRHTQEEGREALRSRFSDRADLAATFVTVYVRNIADRETAYANRALTQGVDERAMFAEGVATFGFTAAVLLDDEGRVLEVSPIRDDLVGTLLTDTYEHLATAVGGTVAISNVVPSAALSEPVVAIAVPFETVSGRHVFSGAFSAEETPLGDYFDAIAPVSGGQAYLVDAHNTPIVEGRSTTPVAPLGSDLLEQMTAGSGEIALDGDGFTYARSHVDGTEWDVILLARSSGLYATIDRSTWPYRYLITALAAGSLAAFILLVRLARARATVANIARTQGKQAMMLRSIVANNQSLIYVKDLDGRYVMVNESFQRTFSTSEKEVLGRTDDDVNPLLTPSWRASDLRARSGLYEVEEQSEVDGVRRVFESTKFPLLDTAGEIYGICGVSLDVTEPRALAEAADAARERAATNAAAQTEFAASTSHELRTPTAAIIGYVEETLDLDDLSDVARSYLDIVHRNSNHLSLLIDDLLTLGEADIQASIIRVEPTDLGRLVRHVVSTLHVAAQRGDVLLHVTVAGDLPAALVDPMRTEQAITNLVSNAVKFTPPGGTVDVRLVERADEGTDGLPGDRVLELAVVDTGIGIEPDEIGRVFDRFFRSRTGRAVKGTGLGLPIAKTMIEAQNGRISVTSILGHGTTFTVELPVDRRARRTEMELAAATTAWAAHASDRRR